MAVKDMTGVVFNKLMVIRRAENNKSGSVMWECVCECGNKRVVAGSGLRAGRNKSCGCASPRFKSAHGMPPGMCGSRIYKIWVGMLHRCSEQSTGKSKRNYFDKGIRVCDRWTKFENFESDMGHPEQNFTLDRKDGTKGYAPDNCRWATPKEQANNMSSNRLMTVNGITKTVAEWSEETGIKANTITYRLRRGWSVEKCIEKNPILARVINAKQREIKCSVCNKIFIPRASQVTNGNVPRCSHKCAALMRNSPRKDHVADLQDE